MGPDQCGQCPCVQPFGGFKNLRGNPPLFQYCGADSVSPTWFRVEWYCLYKHTYIELDDNVSSFASALSRMSGSELNSKRVRLPGATYLNRLFASADLPYQLPESIQIWLKVGHPAISTNDALIASAAEEPPLPPAAVRFIGL